ncbi:MAG: thioredoxin domain-containing protein [Proteobacteria bacterium]|nr:thioredoxin domain-containing protein [Pseudomonadota bacterium]
MRAFVTSFILGSALALGATSAKAADMTDDHVNELIEAYIKAHPHVIFNAVSDYLVKEEQKSAAKAVEDAFNNPVPFTLSDHTPVLGDKDAPVTIIQFAEFECPFCATAHETLTEVMRRYKSKVRLAFVHMPLSFHKHAIPAAKAAIAAQRQGKFWEYHDALFANQDKLGEKLFIQTAKELGLDMAKFDKDRNDPALDDLIQTDSKSGAAIGARGTPYFLINGVAVNGAQPIEAFEAVIERHLANLDKKGK